MYLRKPASESEGSLWKPSSELGSIWKPSSESQVSFWKPSSEESEGSIWIPSSESEGSFWKPSSEFSTCKSSVSFWRWKPSSESESVCSSWKPLKPSSESEASIRKPSSESEEPNPSLKYNITRTWCQWYSDEPIENVQRRFRRDVAKEFQKEYKFEHGNKTCICSNGIFSLPDKCYDSLWVAVHGTDSICMVTRSKDMDMARVGSYYQRYYTYEQTLRSLTEAVISEIECLPYGDEELREKSNKGIEKPFGVVSVIPGTKKVGHEDSSSAEYDEEKAIKYLKEKLKTDSAFTYRKTLLTALSAFQHLCRQEFLAEDIWVTTWVKGECSAQHLRLEQKMWHLAIICKCCFASRSSVFFLTAPPPAPTSLNLDKPFAR